MVSSVVTLVKPIGLLVPSARVEVDARPTLIVIPVVGSDVSGAAIESTLNKLHADSMLSLNHIVGLGIYLCYKIFKNVFCVIRSN